MTDPTPLTEYVNCRTCGMTPVAPGEVHADYGTVPEPRWHKAADVEAALAAQATAHEAARDSELKGWTDAAYEQGVSDERARIRAGVEALLVEVRSSGRISLDRAEVLAIIDGEGE